MKTAPRLACLPACSKGINPASFFTRPALAVGVWLLAAVSAWAQPIRIMPLGDSITFGVPVAGGYRAPLYRLLTNAGYSVDFVGTQTGGSVASLPDPHHEGYSGWRISQIDSIILNVFNAVPEPDIILLLLGTNDYGANDDPANATNRLESLIVKMATNRPNATIIVANLLVRGEPYNTQIQTGFNPFLPGICERQRALGRKVYFRDLRSAVPLGDMPDNLHPNQLGYNKMATNWFAAITDVLCTNCPPRFSVQPMNQIVLPGTNVSVVATMTGTGEPIHFQWRFEGANIPNATNATYSFTNASFTNGHGNFSVVASNDFGTVVSSNALIFVRIAPVILTLPVTQTVLQGQDATFTCVATGAPPIYYRWLRSGLPVFTNTSGIGVFTNVQSSRTNGIRCDARNVAGNMASPSVSLIMIPDFDHDGIADSWEAQYGLNTNSAADALLDFDDDGMSNRDEYIAGTTPTNPLSLLNLTLAATDTGVWEFTAQSNIAYTIQYRTNLNSGSWGNLTNISAQPQVRTMQVDTHDSSSERERFYRLVTPPVP